jgi:ribosome-binding protein aMBF1 (putative translation factor)
MTSELRQRREERDAAFAEALEALRTRSPLQREMIDARVRAGLTQEQLARRMGTKQSAIARLESGRILPSIPTLKKLAEATESRLVVRLAEA